MTRAIVSDIDPRYSALLGILEGPVSEMLEEKGMQYKHRSWREIKTNNFSDDQIIVRKRFWRREMVADIAPLLDDERPVLDIRVINPAYLFSLSQIAEDLSKTSQVDVHLGLYVQ